MKKIIIYYGPKSEFEKILPADNRKTLSEFISKDDAKRREFSFNKSQVDQDCEDGEEFEYIENIIAYSESYAGITEGAIQRFSDLFEMYQIDNLYLQNPPLQIQTRLEQTFSSIIDKKYYEYNSISISNLKKLNSTFSDKIIGQEHVQRKLLTSFYPLVKGTNDYTVADADGRFNLKAPKNGILRIADVNKSVAEVKVKPMLKVVLKDK